MNTPLSDFFTIEYQFLANKLEDPDEFQEQAEIFAKRFDLKAEDSLFRSTTSENNITIDGLETYLKNAWDSIKENKKLNLPGQRKVVSEFRCEQFKTEALEASDLEIKQLVKDSLETRVQDFPFSQRAEGILATANKHYHENS